jgi:hypothetical protein
MLDLIRRGQSVSAFQGEGFFASQWDDARFARHLVDCIRKKEVKYTRNRNFFDVLIVRTDEPWLSPYHVEERLQKVGPLSAEGIRSAYLLMSGNPGY